MDTLMEQILHMEEHVVSQLWFAHLHQIILLNIVFSLQAKPEALMTPRLEPA